MGERLAQKPSLSLILNYESAAMSTTAKEAPLTTAAWPLAAAQIMDFNMVSIDVVSGDIMDHRSLLRRLNPGKEPFFISDILLLRVRAMMWLVSMSGDWVFESSKLLYTT